MYIYITVVSGQAGGRTFQNWTAYSPYSGTKNVPIGCGQAFCAWQQQSLDLSFLCHRFSRLDLFSFYVISSHQLFLEIAYCIPFSPQSVLSHCISAPFIPSCLKSSLFFWIGSGLRSSSQLLSIDSSHRTACNWLIWFDIFWSELVHSLLISSWTFFDSDILLN